METLPPLTIEDLERDFENTSFSTYVFVGDESDEGWENAQIAFGLIPKLRIYRAARDSLLRNDWLGGGHPRGIAFDWQGKAVGFLNASDSRDLKRVVKAINESRQP